MATKELAAKKIEIFTDGACSGNPGPGGWGALLRYTKNHVIHEKKMCGAELATTNNRMELTAVIKALASLKESCIIDITTDSQYVRNGITEWLPTWKKNNWRTSAKKEVKNIDLWQELEMLVDKHTIKWHWVRGHVGHTENEIADNLARDAIKKIKAIGV
jgi:ribonuclease HI